MESKPIKIKETIYLERQEVEKEFTYEEILDLFDNDDRTLVVPLVRRCMEYEKIIEELRAKNK